MPPRMGGEGHSHRVTGGVGVFGRAGGDPAPVTDSKAQHLLVAPLLIYRSSRGCRGEAVTPISVVALHPAHGLTRFGRIRGFCSQLKAPKDQC